MTLQVELSDDLDAAVHELVGQGRYKSAEEVVSAGVRLVQDQEQRRVELETKLMAGLADIEAGRVHNLEDVLRELDARYAAMSEPTTAG